MSPSLTWPWKDGFEEEKIKNKEEQPLKHLNWQISIP